MNWKEAIVAQSRNYSENCLKVLRGNVGGKNLRIVGVGGEIRTKYLPNAGSCRTISNTSFCCDISGKQAYFQRIRKIKNSQLLSALKNETRM